MAKSEVSHLGMVSVGRITGLLSCTVFFVGGVWSLLGLSRVWWWSGHSVIALLLLILYSLLSYLSGFVAGWLLAGIYNLTARYAGGIEIEIR